MTTINIKTQKARDLLYPIVGETHPKTYFSYYSLFKDGAMFCLYKNDNLYLFIPECYLEEVKQHPDMYLLQDKRNGLHNQSFYYIPPRLYPHLMEYRHWIDTAITEIQHRRQQLKQKKKQTLRAQINLDIHIERLLNKIDIYTVEQLNEQGAINIFVKLASLGYDVRNITLLRLHGAIQNKLFYLYDDKEQQALFKEADIALDKAGLRKLFQKK
ncbi:hypothetical protein A4G19_04035 [Pasteurellaceae bacterium Macca]|nr:hypothetical protein [Pasteurellaceae bacterium Macca]